jgi:phenylacetate-CoA ligase
MSPGWVNQVVMPLAQRIVGAPFYRRYSALLESQFFGAERLRQIQTEKLRALLCRAFLTVPFYRQFSRAAGCKGEDIREIEDLKQLPVVTKDMIRNSKLEDWTTEDVPRAKWRMNSTSGTTGKPLQFVMSDELVAMRYGRYLRANAWAGILPGKFCIRIWGPRQWYVRTGIRWVLNMKVLSAFEMTEEEMEGYVRFLRSHQVAGIEAYTSAAVTLGRYILRRGYDDLHIPFVATAGETLFPEHRQQIEQAFHCRVLSRYGCREFGLIAQECPAQHGLHINQESFIVEYQASDQQWADGIPRGKVLITNLDNHTMPFIRYQLGDLASPLSGTCLCGRQLSIMMHPHGRVVDYLQTPGGKAVSVHFFTLLFAGYTGEVREFQIRQKSPDEITVLLVPDLTWTEAKAARLERDIRRHLGARVRLKIELVDDIPLDSNGKRKILVNEMALGQTPAREVTQ